MLVGLALTAAAADFHGDRLLVKARQPLDPGVAVAPGVYVDEALPVPGWYQLTVPRDPLAHLHRVRLNPLVSHVEVDPVIRVASTAEPSFPEQWALENLPSRRGTFDADIDVTRAWDAGTTGDGVVVAVIDTGVDLSHPEITPALWVNPGEIPDNGLDDDGNGYVDDVHGIDAHLQTGDPSDLDTHGTSCAGIIAAQPDGNSIVGIAPDARIMAINIFQEGDSQPLEAFGSAAARAFVYAGSMGADVLNNSWHYGRTESTLVSDAIDMAIADGALVVVSAGNTPLDSDEGGFWPASTPRDELISVAASERHDQRVHMPGIWGSAFGATTVHLAAPGEGVLTTQGGGGYTDFSGTSASAPVVSATAALIWAAVPELEAAEVRQILIDSVDPNGMQTVSGGRVNAGQAVHLATTDTPPLDLTIAGTTTPELGTATSYAVDADDDVDVQWWFGDDGSTVAGAEVTHTFRVPGSHRVVVEATAADGTTGRATLTTSMPFDWQPSDHPGVESLHDVPNNLGAFAIEAGEDVEWTRLHFSRIGLPSAGWDVQNAFVAVYDPEGLWMWSFAGDETDVVTPPLRGNAFALAWVGQSLGSSDPMWGVKLDRIEVWRPGYVPPQPTPDPAPAEAVLNQGTSCSTADAPWWLISLVVLAGRRTRACGSRPAPDARAPAPAPQGSSPAG